MTAAPTEKLNRRQRRHAKQRRDDGVRWHGECRCADCTDAEGRCVRMWPTVYVMSVELIEQRERGRKRKVLNAITMSYECFLEINAPKERSPSAAAFEWLETEHDAGININLNEAELRTENVAAEVHRLESLRRYLIGTGLGDVDRMNREKRYLQIVELWPERRQWRRLGQWLRAEFPGWTMNGEHT